MGNRLSLQIFLGDEQIGVESFDREIIKIGRLASAHLKLEDPKVSRIHAVIEVSRGGEDISIIDMGSAEGTFVNGEKVTKIKLKEKDEIRLGDTRLILSQEEEGEQPAVAAATAEVVREVPAGEQQALAAAPTPSDGEQVFEGGEDFSPDTPTDVVEVPPPEAVAAATAAPGFDAATDVAPAPGAGPAAGWQPEPMPPVSAAPPAQVAAPPPAAPPPAAPAPAAPAPAAPPPVPSTPPVVAAEAAPPPIPAQHAVAVAPEAVTQPPAMAPMMAQPGTYADYGPTPMPELTPGVSGGFLVPPLADAPPPEWFDPYGEFRDVAIEQESQVSAANRCLEIAISWDDKLLDVRHYFEPKQVTMGETKRSEIFVVSEGLPDTNFPIIRFMTGEYVLTYFEGLEGSMEYQDKVLPLAALRGQADDTFPRSYQYNLPLGSVTKIEYGGLTMQLRFVPPPGIIASSPFQEINYNWLNVFLISLFLHAGFLATTALYPYDTRSLEEDLFSSPNRFAQFILNPPEEEKNDLLAKLMKGKEGESSAKHAGEDGKAGRQDAKDTGKRMASKSDKPTNEMIVQAKMNQLFGKDGSGGVGSIFGGGIGGELESALGGVTGTQIGDSYGFGGLGLRGHGPGGGGSSTTTFGVGNIGTRGRGGGSSGYGSGAGGLGGKTDRNIKISQGSPVVMGSLDKEIIRRIIRENIAQIRYCYERELARSPGLYGKIMVKFIIAATGSVSNSSVAQSTMKNAAVESCIVGKVRGWRFPKPKGGGIVIVTYPFIFKQGG